MKGLENDNRTRTSQRAHKGTSDHVTFRGSPTGDVISGEKAPQGRISRNFRLCRRAPHPREPPSGSCDLRSLRVTFHSVISYEKAPLGRILLNFRLRMRTPFQGSSSESRDQIRSLPVAMVLVLLYYILYYYYSKKKAREAKKKRGKMTSFPVT